MASSNGMTDSCAVPLLQDAEREGRCCDTAYSAADASVPIPMFKDFHSSKHALMIRYGAYIFVWVIGLCALVKLLTDFSSSLKPLVLALLVASILEWMVQMWELIFWKFGNFVSLFARKVLVTFRISWIYVRWACHATFNSCRKAAKRTRYPAQENAKKWIEELCDWSPLKSRWHGSYAGQNSALRFISVLMTLLLVALALFGSYSLIMTQIGVMLEQLDGYKKTITEDVQWLSAHMDELTDRVPSILRGPVRRAIARFQNVATDENFLNRIGSYANSFLEGFISQTESLAMGLCFFFLYTFLWLFVPMHLNSHAEKANTFKVVHFRPKRSVSFVEGEDTPYAEVQEQLYRVVWQYFLSMCVINGVFALAVQILLSQLEVNLSTFVAIACFFLGFIPELGTIIAIVLPLPLVVFAPREEHDATSQTSNGDLVNPFSDFSSVGWKTLWVLVGMILIKLLVANVLTSIVMGRNKTLSGAVHNKSKRFKTTIESNVEDKMEVKETHPVVILFVVVLSGQIWGPVGMLISVPVVSLCRLAVNVWYLDEAGEAEA
jgi:predicted PurR-regulated permease PerM